MLVSKPTSEYEKYYSNINVLVFEGVFFVGTLAVMLAPNYYYVIFKKEETSLVVIKTREALSLRVYHTPLRDSLGAAG